MTFTPLAFGVGLFFTNTPAPGRMMLATLAVHIAYGLSLTLSLKVAGVEAVRLPTLPEQTAGFLASVDPSDARKALQPFMKRVRTALANRDNSAIAARLKRRNRGRAAEDPLVADAGARTVSRAWLESHRRGLQLELDHATSSSGGGR